MIASWRGLLLASSAWAFIGSIGSLTLGMETAAAQDVLSEGPGPATTLPDWYQFQGTAVSGAVQAIAPSPNTPGIIYLGSANGGVWKSVNDGASWQPLTDGQSSLSVGALSVDPTDAAHVIAGIGRTRSAAYAGGPLIGLLSSDNGGQSWTTLAPSPAPSPMAAWRAAPVARLPSYRARRR